MKLVSVIIPVYKVEKYLHECLNSVISSTYKNLEIILIDDGSPDNCGKICDEYALKDSRVKVIHQENKGLCTARNFGLKIAKGEYITFADSDDVVSPILYEELVRAIESENADWSVSEYTRKEDGLVVEKNTAISDYKCLEDFESQLSVLTCAPLARNISWSSSYVWNKLYKKEKIKKEFSVNLSHCED